MIELNGLTSSNAQKRLKQYGPNTIPEKKENSFHLFLQKFWGPIPWLLELIILLEIFLGKFAEAWIIAALILFNALVSFLQEDRARDALRLLRDKLNVYARALRDGEWKLIPAQDLVPQDIIRIRMGDIVPADVKIQEGNV